MKPTGKRTDDELEYAIRDCARAIEANADNRDMSVLLKYIEEKNACQGEQARRARLRLMRQALSSEKHDPLTVQGSRARRQVEHRNRHPYSVDSFRSACFQIGWYRQYNLI